LGARYEAGCKLYVDAKGQLVVLKGELGDAKTTDEFRTRWAKPWSRLTSHGGGYQLPPQLPEAYTTDSDLILLGDSGSGFAMAALQASELLPQVVDAKYPGPGKALINFAWSPSPSRRTSSSSGHQTPTGCGPACGSWWRSPPASDDRSFQLRGVGPTSRAGQKQCCSARSMIDRVR
jgi:hypothetical protein